MFKPDLIKPECEELPLVVHKRLSSGDQIAFRCFFDQYQPKLFGYILRIVKSKEIAEELVTDIFVKIWSAKEIMSDVENADAFLYRMAVNKALDFMRIASREKKTRMLLYDYQDRQLYEPEMRLETKELEQHISQCLQMLSSQQQLIVKLSREEGLTHDQIAKHLNLSRNTVKNHMVSALKNLKRFLKERQLFFLLMVDLLIFFSLNRSL